MKYLFLLLMLLLAVECEHLPCPETTNENIRKFMIHYHSATVTPSGNVSYMFSTTPIGDDQMGPLVDH